MKKALLIGSALMALGLAGCSGGDEDIKPAAPTVNVNDPSYEGPKPGGAVGQEQAPQGDAAKASSE